MIASSAAGVRLWLAGAASLLLFAGVAAWLAPLDPGPLVLQFADARRDQPGGQSTEQGNQQDWGIAPEQGGGRRRLPP